MEKYMIGDEYDPEDDDFLEGDLDNLQDMDCLKNTLFNFHHQCGAPAEEDTFYNIEPTENPYLQKWVATTLENVSEKFAKSFSNIWSIPNIVECLSRAAYVLDVKVLTEAISDYKEKLDKNSKEEITNPEFLTAKCMYIHDPQFAQSIKKFLNDRGLSFNTTTGRISLRKKSKVKKASKTVKKTSKTEINSQFRYLLSRYSQKLNMDIVFRVTSKNLYTTLTFFQAATPKVSYEELLKDGYSQFDKECKRIWDDPKVLLTQPKAAKKAASSKGTT